MECGLRSAVNRGGEWSIDWNTEQHEGEGVNNGAEDGVQSSSVEPEALEWRPGAEQQQGGQALGRERQHGLGRGAWRTGHKGWTAEHQQWRAKQRSGAAEGRV